MIMIIITIMNAGCLCLHHQLQIAKLADVEFRERNTKNTDLYKQ